MTGWVRGSERHWTTERPMSFLLRKRIEQQWNPKPPPPPPRPPPPLPGLSNQSYPKQHGGRSGATSGIVRRCGGGAFATAAAAAAEAEAEAEAAMVASGLAARPPPPLAARSRDDMVSRTESPSFSSEILRDMMEATAAAARDDQEDDIMAFGSSVNMEGVLGANDRGLAPMDEDSAQDGEEEKGETRSESYATLKHDDDSSPGSSTVRSGIGDGEDSGGGVKPEDLKSEVNDASKPNGIEKGSRMEVVCEEAETVHEEEYDDDDDDLEVSIDCCVCGAEIVTFIIIMASSFSFEPVFGKEQG